MFKTARKRINKTTSTTPYVLIITMSVTDLIFLVKRYKHVCNSGTTVWNSGRRERKNRMIECQEYCNIKHL
jgi:uncharacterized protein HemY